MKKSKPLLTRSAAHRVMPLEARLMFDAAAATDVAKVASDAPAEAAAAPDARTTAPSLQAATGPSSWTAEQQQNWTHALAQVNAVLANLPQRNDYAALLSQSFGAAGTEASTFAARIDALAQLLSSDGLKLQVELRSNAELQGAFAAYAAQGPDGRERIYINADWIARGVGQQAIAAVLLEETGHALDQRLNAGVDTAGDEGERFSALVRGQQLTELQSAALLADADQTTLLIDGVEVGVEFAELSVPFSEGFIGTQGNAAGKADGVLNFATLGVVRASFFQDASGGSFTLQGNDIPGGLRLTLSSGTVISITGAINWRVTTSGNLQCFGFVPDAGTTPVQFSYGAGLTYTISNTSNFGLELVGSSYSTADNSNVSGNAATTGLLSALNTYLATVQANDPNGPVTVTTLSTTDTTPTLSGTATLGGGETLTVAVNGVTYNTGNGLSVGGGTWSLTIPNGNALALGTYSVTATITNGSGYTLTDTSSSELVITAPDLTAPVVTASQSFNYAENQTAGTTIATVAATDAVGVTGYRFSSTGTSTSADGYFTINSSGQISLTTAGAAAAPNDYETAANSFTYGVQARDAAGNWSSAVNVTLNETDVDDAAPVVTASQSFSYAENQTAGTVLGTVLATDAVGVTGYRFSGSGTSTSADGYFTINSSGQISLTTAGAAAAPNDYETTANSFTYGVQARDAAGNWSSAVNVTLNETDVDDTAPVVTASQSFSYAENQTAGTVLGTVLATDAAGVTGYRFSGSGTSTSADGYFTINSSGQISLTTAGAAAAPNDYETTANSFTYGVQARDAAGNWSSAVNVTLNETDVDDTAPVVSNGQSFSYAENQSAGTTLGAVAATDAVGVTGYRFSGSGTSTSADGYFTINSSGQISLTTAGAAAAPNDYETTANGFTYGVQARDAAGNWSSAVNVTLNETDVDDTAPVVSNGQSFSYAENQTAGTTLGAVAATDAVGVTGYRFSGSGTTTSADGFYSINSSGQVSLTTAGAAAAVNDYESTPNSFTYGVEARDAVGNWSSSVDVTLNVTDLNETVGDVTAPVIASGQSLSYAENQSTGNTLGTVVATDAVGVTGYRFSGSGTTTSADGYYTIDNSGQIGLTTAGAAAASNDYETTPNSFTYGVEARDAAGNWSSSVNVTLNLTDLDDTAPVVAASQSFSYAENQASGSMVGTVAATDAVGVTGYRFSGTGTATSADGYYTIDSSGQVSLTTAGAAAAANDYETTPNSFTYGVEARDAAGNWSGAVNVTLNVTDLNDNVGDITAPVVTAGQSFSYAENQAAGSVLGTVAATDAVGVTGYRFAGTGTSTSADGCYTLDSSGQISLTAAGAAAGRATNDYEATPHAHTYGVEARDAAGNWSGAVNVTLHVTDVNEATPDVGQGAEDTPLVGNVLANDGASNSFLASYTVGGVSVSAGQPVAIDGVGTVTLFANGDYSFVPVANWSGSVPAIAYVTHDGSTANLNLTIAPVNDAPALTPDALTTFEDMPWSGQLPAGTDAEGDSLSYALVIGGAHGTVSVSSGGHYDYVPDAGYSGTDRFLVSVSDGQGGSAQVWVDVNVVPAPTIGLPAESDLGASNSDRRTSADVITLAGVGTPGQTLNLYSPAGQLVGTTVVDGQGHWAVTGIDMRTLVGDNPAAAAGAPGAYTFTARAVLPGNVMSAARPITVEREQVLPPVAAPEPVVAPAPVPQSVVAEAVAAPTVAEAPRPFDSALRTDDARPGAAIQASQPVEPGTRAEAVLQVRESNAADIYTRPSGFQIMVNPSPEPSLKLFRGLDDQVAKLGTVVNLQVPADTFVHTNVHETVTLQATLADGRPLPKWLHFDGKSGAITGEVPSEWRDDVVIRVTARDSQGREARALMRVKITDPAARVSSGLSRQLMAGPAWRGDAAPGRVARG